MQYAIPVKVVIVLATLLCAVELGASVNDCGDSTFINQSSGGSPTVADCQQINANIIHGGSWTVLPGVQRTLVTYGTCALGVTVTSPGIAYVGNEDIIDLINSSIQQFTFNGLVGAKGTMGCDGGSTIDWGIYHT